VTTPAGLTPAVWFAGAMVRSSGASAAGDVKELAPLVHAPRAKDAARSTSTRGRRVMAAPKGK
jgi:hypothetical protein